MANEHNDQNYTDAFHETSTLEKVFTKLVFDKERTFGDRDLVESHNSAILTTIDISPPDGFNVKFVYNRFEIDETVNDMARNPFIFRQIGSDIIDDNELRKLARFNKLSWNKRSFRQNRDNLGLLLPRYTKHQIENFIINGRLNSATDFSNGNFFNLIIRDSTADNKLYLAVSSSFEILKKRTSFEERQTRTDIDVESKILKELSAIEKARRINENIHSQATQKFLNKDVFEPELAAKSADADKSVIGITESIINSFGSNVGEEDFQIRDQFSENRKLEQVKIFKEIPLKATIGNKYLFTLAKTVENDESSIFSDEFKNFALVFEEVERDAIVEESIQKFELAVLERSITAIDSVSLNNLCIDVRPGIGNEPNRNAENIVNAVFEQEGYKTTIRVIGYIIDKTFVDSFGNEKIYDPIVIDDESITTYVDDEVLYGGTYHYKVSTLVEIILPFNQDGSHRFARILVKCDYTLTTVNTVETIPPLTPSDFQIRWSAAERAPHLTWSRDLSPQQDVTKFMIFKRNNINQPFTLLGLINSTPQNYPSETFRFDIDKSVNVIEEQFGRAFYFDKTFHPDETAIYALIAGDAHEMYSNYSIQLEVKLDKRANKLLVKQISNSGAPIPYPNFYVNKSLFDKQIFTQRAKSLKLIFNPDTIDIDIQNDSGLDGITKPVINFSTSDVVENVIGEQNYKLSIINTDLGRSQTVTIKVNDKRFNRS